uniref:PARN like, ribonuclease domain containing 1 n=1 Tax=Buteo japonicus TaxID=224669 RepID=A0A8C0BVV3_9AVES
IDMEFTGLHSTFPQNNQPSLFDSPAERYLKARQSVQHFTVTQLGNSPGAGEYVVHSYNFFLFPSTLGVTDVEFTLSASSIQFLSHYGFDYNKFLKDGIPYMNEVQEKILSQHLLEGSWKVSRSIFCTLGDKHLVNPSFLLFFFFSGSQMFEVQLVLRQALPNVWTQPLGDKVMVKKVSPQHRQLLENSPDDCCQKELILLSARGFTNLFQTLVKAKKVKRLFPPLIFHLLWICYTGCRGIIKDKVVICIK